MPDKSVFEMFQRVCRTYTDKTAYLSKKNGRWVGITWAEQERAVRRVGRALIGLGVQPGDRVGLLCQTRLEWLQVDLGIAGAGAATLGIYPSTLAADCAYLVDFAGTRLLVLENAEQLAKILRVRAQMPTLEKIVVIDDTPDRPEGVLSWPEFLAKGDAVPESDLDARVAAVAPDDVAALVATSGTTGQQKLAMITHGNMLFSAWSVGESLPIRNGLTTLLFLPLAHVFARVTAYCCLSVGVVTAFAQSLQTVGEDLAEIKPDFIASVPRIFEKVQEKIFANVAASSPGKQKIFKWALGVGLQKSRRLQAKKPVPPLLALRYAIADKLVFHKIRHALGGRMFWAISGAAPLSASLAEFFHACGVLVLEGLGMTENTSFSHVNRTDDYRFGSVGLPGPGVEQKRAEDGEILLRAGNVMKGYYNNPEATAEALDPDRWLHTGDIGEIDDKGFLRITDRKKDLIITAGGKNVAPQRLERILRMSPFVSQAVVFGDKKKFIAALITLDPANIEKWAKDNGLGAKDAVALAAEPKVRTLIEREVATANEQLASFEQVKKFTILPHDLSIEAGELTPTLKVKRKVVGEKYRATVEALYAEAGAAGELRAS